jgi:signal transduction histidine kinase/CheY-like chemotaxis protein/integral membrane sensor domain MASE1
MNARPDQIVQPVTIGPRELLQAVLFALVYWVLRVYCLSLPAAASNVSYVWLPDGLALGALLCTRVRHWPPYLLAIVAVSLLDARRELGPTLLGSTFNVVEPAIVAFALSRLLGSPARIDGIRSVSILFFGTILFMAGATLATSAVNWMVYSGSYWEVWRVWVVSDTLGMLLIAPLMVAWAGASRPALRELHGPRLLEGVLAFGGLIATTYLAHTIHEPFGKGVSLAAVTMPFLLWSGLRFGVRGATLALAIFSLQSFWYASHGLGHFARNFSDPRESVIALQIYLAMLGVVMLLPAALLSERRRAMTESAEWRQRYESLLAVSHVLMYEVDAGTRTLTWGGNVRDVLGIAPENIPDVPRWIERVHPEDRHLLSALRERFASGEVNSLQREYRLRRDDGNYIYVGATAYGITGDEKTGKPASRPMAPLDVRVVGFIRNISDRKRDDEQRRELEDRLKQSEKMEAIGRFADGIAHDFNNILGAILGYGELAKGKAAAGSDIRRYLDTIYSAGERGRALVAQILTFSRARPAEKRPMLVAELIEEVVVQVEGSLPDGISITIANEYPGAVVLGEATQLHQLAMNLCTNAVQAMPAGGVVELSVRAVRIETERAAHLGTLRPANYVEIKVRDSGLGMDRETAAKIFEPFFTTKPFGRGTGLGLSLVQSIALEHGGALDIESAPGQGTRISIFLPEIAGGWEKPAVPERELPRGSGETIMIIDDEPALADMAQEMLAELGYETLAFNSGVDALDAYEKDPARFDAILSDELMPQLTGTQLTARLRQARATLPILIISGYGGPDFESRAREAGVDRLLRKPYQKRDLAEALASVLPARA